MGGKQLAEELIAFCETLLTPVGRFLCRAVRPLALLVAVLGMLGFLLCFFVGVFFLMTHSTEPVYGTATLPNDAPGPPLLAAVIFALVFFAGWYIRRACSPRHSAKS